MAHYFDDIFHRHTNPKTPGIPSTPRPHHFRRSSTARSISNRSDFEASVNGDVVDDSRSVSSAQDPEAVRHRHEADQHLRLYITDQIEKVIEGEDDDESPEEFQAMP
jgi:hypothetical protein